MDGSSGGLAGRAMLAIVGWWLLGAANAWHRYPARNRRRSPRQPLRQPYPPPRPCPPPTAREAMLEQRILQLESMMNQIQYQGAAPGGAGMTQPGGSSLGTEGSGLPPSQPGVTPVPGAVESADLAKAASDRRSTSRSGGIGVPGQSFPPVPPPNNRFNSPATLEDKRGPRPVRPGLRDRHRRRRIHLPVPRPDPGRLSGLPAGRPETVHDTFGLPRQWWMFSGHITKEVGYFVSFQKGFDTFNGLDMFLDFNYDRRLQFRVGRMKTPFTYEFFVEPIQGLITPERSVFFNNFAQNRDVGMMAYGQLFNGPNFDQVSKVQYAAGIFNAARNGYLAIQDRKAFSGIREFPSFRRPDGLARWRTSTSAARSSHGDEPRRIPPNPLRTVVPTDGQRRSSASHS